RLPDVHVAQLFGELRRVAGLGECFAGEDRRCSVMTVSAFACGWKSCDDDVRLKTADVPHDVRQDRVVSPDSQRLGRVLGETEVDRPGEELFAHVDAPRVQPLLRAQDAEVLAY